MDFVLNRNIVVLDKEKGNLILKNNSSDRIFFISDLEYEIINYFSNDNSIENTFDKFKNILDVSGVDEIYELIGIAKENQILIEKGYSFNNEIDAPWIALLRLHFPLINFDFLTVNKILKLFSFKLTDKNAQKGFVLMVIILYGLSLFLFSNLIDISFRFRILTLVFFISASSIFHELGHFVSYLFFKGKGASIGLGLMYSVYPILYTNTPSIYFWDNERYKKVIISLFGSVFDLITLIFMFSINNLLGVGLISLRIIQNLNPLMPSSDGYFVFKDLFGKEPLADTMRNYALYKNTFKSERKILNKYFPSFLLIYLLRISLLFIYIVLIYLFLFKEIAYYFIIN